MSIKNKKILYILIPTLLASTLVGCSKDKTTSENTDNSISQEQTHAPIEEEKVKYSSDFKENFLKVANHYNNMDGFKESFNLIEWDENTNKPILDESMEVTKVSDNEIVIEIIKELTDLEVRCLNVQNKINELLEEVEILSQDNNDYMNTDKYKEYEAASDELSTLLMEYYETSKIKEKEKGHHLTVLTKCLVYSMVGGGEHVHDVIDEYFSYLGFFTSILSSIGDNEINSDYASFFLNNLYICDNNDSNKVYGKLSYDKKIDLDNKKLIKSFVFKKYSPEMDKEIKEYEEHMNNFDKEYEQEF